MKKRKINLALLMSLILAFTLPIFSSVFVYCPDNECNYNGCPCQGENELLDNCCFACYGIIWPQGCTPGFPPPTGCIGDMGYMECCGPTMCHPKY